jgi:uncharacterized protein (UPF0264 family)
MANGQGRCLACGSRGIAFMTRLLASVTSVEEALTVLDAGADIIDLKDPGGGALGALPLARIGAILNAVDGRRPVSATIGDLPPDPEMLSRAVRATAATGVDLIKVGLFGEVYANACSDALAKLATNNSLIAVLFADLKPDFDIVIRLADTGFAGVMLDTANKAAGGLCQHMTRTHLSEFVQAARQRGLLTGLAGSLRREDIKPLLATGADYLGFRTALCSSQWRTAEIDPVAVAAIRAQLPRSPIRFPLDVRQSNGRHVSLAQRRSQQRPGFT